MPPTRSQHIRRTISGHAHLAATHRVSSPAPTFLPQEFASVSLIRRIALEQLRIGLDRLGGGGHALAEG